MKRIQTSPRQNWQQIVEADGLRWHTEDGQRCWNEGAAYVFSEQEIDLVRSAAREVHGMCMEAVAHVARHECWSRLGLRGDGVRLARESWERRDWGLCGRFDFLFDENGQAKLLEYNAETALSMVESSVIQSRWRSEVMPDSHQFNDLRCSLVDAWRHSGFRRVHCAWRPRHLEIEGAARFMAGVIREAGLEATLLSLHRMGWNSKTGGFVGADDEPVECCFKIYPWAWMARERFASHVSASGCHFVEPPWKLILGSKGLLAILWELFPEHPALMPCFETSEKSGPSFVSKPMFGHEGQNVTVCRDGNVIESVAGEYGDEPAVYQTFVESPRYDDHLAQLSVWMVGAEPVALGVRESRDAIITNNSSFVPHVVA